MTARRVLYEGHVQGVGFRYSVRQIAMGFEVTGFVRNLRDGRVELEVNGNDGEIDAFLEAVTQSSLRSHIRHQTQTPLAEPPQTHGFEIRHD